MGPLEPRPAQRRHQRGRHQDHERRRPRRHRRDDRRNGGPRLPVRRGRHLSCCRRRDPQGHPRGAHHRSRVATRQHQLPERAEEPARGDPRCARLGTLVAGRVHWIPCRHRDGAFRPNQHVAIADVRRSVGSQQLAGRTRCVAVHRRWHARLRVDHQHARRQGVLP
ncbi:hypothetical protein ACFPRL_32015 [Pseudoclavibacter helvolus]